MKIGSEEKISTNKTNLNAMGDRVYPFQGYLQLVSSVKTVKQHIGMRYIKTEVLLSPPTPLVTKVILSTRMSAKPTCNQRTRRETFQRPDSS